MKKFLVFGLISILANLCHAQENSKNALTQMNVNHNPVVYFEIPVRDMERAVKFYKNVFNFAFEREIIDNNEMALFPFTDDAKGISGALAKGEIYKPTKDGVIIYFKTLDIDNTLKLAVENGGKILYPKTTIGELGMVAEFEDSEGNRIALYQTHD